MGNYICVRKVTVIFQARVIRSKGNSGDERWKIPKVKRSVGGRLKKTSELIRWGWWESSVEVETDLFGPLVHVKDLKCYLENSRKSLKDFKQGMGYQKCEASWQWYRSMPALSIFHPPQPLRSSHLCLTELFVLSRIDRIHSRTICWLCIFCGKEYN